MDEMQGWPQGTELPIGGSGKPWPVDRDPTRNYPRKIFAISAAGSYPIARGAWIEVTGSFGSGWTFLPEGQGSTPVQLKANACFPAPKDGVLIVESAGLGTPKLVIWPEHLGPVIGQGRGYDPPGSDTPDSGSQGSQEIHDGAVLSGFTKTGETFVGTGRKSAMSLYGEVSADTVIRVLYSFNGTDYFSGPSITVTFADDPTFSLDFLTAAPYVAFGSENAVDVLANLSWI